VADVNATGTNEAEIRLAEAQRIREAIYAAFGQERSVMEAPDAYYETDVRIARSTLAAMRRAIEATR
jgi:hypothetical protein